jgi:hypothetical protein
MNLMLKYKKYKSLISCIILLCSLSIINTVEGYIYGKVGLTFHVYLLEIISFVIVVFLLNKMMCMHEDGKCTTIKK